ncbi:MAG: hypothetical protein GTO60_13985, partial [Gammaproteobacteria bacterium]|nr:hypothetical protein [Gammaproteobacteria bacterium]
AFDTLRALEPRFMFDAAGIATGSEVNADTVAQEQAEQAFDSNAVDPAAPAVQDESKNLFDSLTLVETSS